ncbi:MAG: hypothetical protein WBQ44_05590 [Rhodococcus sp. (in: high G+C Gram-positive bacteria)]
MSDHDIELSVRDTAPLQSNDGWWALGRRRRPDKIREIVVASSMSDRVSGGVVYRVADWADPGICLQPD